MSILSKTNLNELDKKLDESIKLIPLLALNKEEATISVLRYFEDFLRLYSKNNSETMLNGEGGLNFVIQWINKYCLTRSSKIYFPFSEHNYSLAHDAFILGMNYSSVWDIMAMLYRGRCIADKGEDGNIKLDMKPQFFTDGEVSDHFIGSNEGPITLGSLNIKPLFTDKEFVELFKVGNKGKKAKYFFTKEDFAKVSSNLQSIHIALWGLNPEWDVGGYTIKEFRIFWNFLASFSLIHRTACGHSRLQGGAIESIVPVKKRKKWVNLILKFSGLEKDVVKNILQDLTYNPKLFGSNKKQPDVSYQPFFKIGNERLALSIGLVMMSSAERNLWDLLSIIRPSIHNRLKNNKESHWISELKGIFESKGLVVFGPIDFEFDGKNSDLDLLVFDFKEKFVLGFELKWLTAPDRIKDTIYTDNQLAKGLTQAELALKWMKSVPEKFVELTGKTRQELMEFQYQSVVMSKNTIGSGWVGSKLVPIINERLLNWILIKPHNYSLKHLWFVGQNRSYQPVKDLHFKESDIEVEFSDVKFIAKNFGLKFTDSKPWKPEVDIDFSGID